MTTKLSVGWEELRILGHAISWHLAEAHLSDDEANALSRLHSACSDVIRSPLPATEWSLAIEPADSLLLTGDTLFVPAEHLRLIMQAASSFCSELDHSKTAIESLTGATF